MDDCPDLDAGHLPPHPVDPPEVHYDVVADIDPWGALLVAEPAGTAAETREDLEGKLADLRAQLAECENALADAREERDTANEDADQLQARLDRIVSFLLVNDSCQGACCARGRAQAATVIRIARGEDGAGKPEEPGHGN